MSVKQLPPAAPIPPAEPDLGRLGRIFVRQRLLVAAIVMLAIIGGVLFTLLQQPRYKSSALIRLEEEEPGTNLLAAFAPPGLAAAAGLGGGGSIQTDIGVLQSRLLAEAVVDSLDLNVVLLDSEMPRDSVLEVVDAPKENLRGGTYRLARNGGDGYTVRPEDGAIGPHPPQVAVGEVFQLAGARLRILPSPAEGRPDELRIAVMPFRSAVGQLQDALSVGRPDPTAQLIQLGFEHPDPVIAAAVPNALARSFVEYKTRENRQQSLSTVGFLEEQVANYENALRSAERDLESFREQARVYSPEEQARSGVQQVATLQAERDALAAEHASLVQLMRRLEAAGPGADGRSPYRQLASFPTFLANGAVQDILRTLTELESERSELLVRRTPENADVQALDARMDELEQQLHRLGTSYAQNLEANLATLNQNLSGYQGQLATIPSREIEMLRLTREQKLLEQVYTLLQTRLKEEQIEATRVAGNVRVVDAALLPLDPASPRPLMNLAIAGLLGLLLAIGVVAVRELAAPRIHSGDDLLLAGVGAPVLGVIPRTGASTTLLAALPGPLHRRLQPPATDATLVTRTEPFGMGAEAYRSLRTGLLRGANGSRPQIVAVTSALSGEGKSVSSSNLSVTLAQQGRPTLVIDADLRGGKLHRLFQIEASPGLAEVLRGEAELGAAVRPIMIPGVATPLHVLPIGSNPLAATELIDSARMAELLDVLRARYEHIVIDTPPLNLVNDAAVLAGAADATLLVARSGVTDRRALQHAVNLLVQLDVPLSGVVLTDAREMGWYRSYMPADAQAGV